MKPFEQHKKREAYGMSIYSEILLDMVSQHPQVTVMGLIADACDNKVASQATIHASLRWLADNKFIKIERSSGDSRMKLCSIMQRGTIYINALQ